MRGANENLLTPVRGSCAPRDPPELEDRQVKKEEEEREDIQVITVHKDRLVHKVPRDLPGHPVLKAK